MNKASIEASTALALACTLVLTGCSSSKNTAEATFEIVPRIPTCSQLEIDGGSAWIKGQLSAFAQQDFKSAYSFASESFQSNRSLEEFTEIISSGYGFLLTSRTNSVGKCLKDGDNFLFNVQVTSESGVSYPMMYALEKTTDVWGINAATLVTDTTEQEPTTPIV